MLPVQDYENIQYDIYCPEYDGSILEFNPTKEKQLRLICWKVKPWKQVWKADSVESLLFLIWTFSIGFWIIPNYFLYLNLNHFNVLHLRNLQEKAGILLPKLFWPTMIKNCSSDQEKVLKFETEGWEFAKFLRSLEQFIQTVKY